MDGYILIDKPKDWTSFDVVNYIRRMVQQNGLDVAGLESGQARKKRFPTGHTGTLDPQATGLMVVLLGKYTKRAMELTKLDKTYQVTMKLGETSTTGDSEGEITSVSDAVPSLDELKAALAKFTGDIMQVPPIYSAMKVNGQRAYKLARAGKEVKLEARPAHVASISLGSYVYPHVMFDAAVSSGTYIRSLVEDVGRELGTGAYMSDLRRTEVGPFKLEDALEVAALSPEALTKNLRILQ